jgi:hypothetical protein
MKKVLTIVLLALALCLLASVAMAATYQNVYKEGDDLPLPGSDMVYQGTSYEVCDVIPMWDTLQGHNTSHDVTVRYYGADRIQSVTVKYISDPHDFSVAIAPAADPNYKAASCSATGTYTMKCSKCNATIIKTSNKTAHEYVYKLLNGADCTKGGEGAMVCRLCGDIQPGTTRKFAPTAHTFQWWNPDCYKVVSIPACTASSKGEVLPGKYQPLCAVCGKPMDRWSGKTDEYYYEDLWPHEYGIAAGIEDYDGHDWDEWVSFAPNCSTPARDIRWCKVCGINETNIHKDSTPAAPNFKTIVAKSGRISCVTPVENLKAVCANCGGTVAGHVLNGGETLTWEGKAPDGYQWNDNTTITYKIVVDADKFLAYVEDSWDGEHAWTPMPHVYDYKDANKVKYDGDKTEHAATCTSSAYTEFYCVAGGAQNADHAYSRVNNEAKPALGHDWGAWIELIAPNFQKNKEGYWTRSCDRCGLTEDAHGLQVPCVGDAHDWVAIKTVPATKEAEGEVTYECSICKQTKTEKLPKVVDAAKYTLTALAYNGQSVTGKVLHAEGTAEVKDLTVRVTFFLAGNYYMATIGDIEADGTFSVDGVGPIEYISVVINGSSSVNPTEVVSYGSGELTVK